MLRKQVDITLSIITIFTAFIFLLAWQIQNIMLLRGDVVWLTHLAIITLNGGSYINNYFEVNPPMSFYVYLPAAFIIKIAGTTLITTVRSYIFTIAAISLVTCYSLLQPNIKDNVNKGALLLTLAAIYVLLPTFEFGQREHISLMFTLPYVLLITNRINNHPVSRWLASIVSLLAGIGFMIKPFFLLPLILIEVYYLFLSKRWLNIIRFETMIIAVIGLSYISWIVIMQPNYLNIIVPLAKQFYYSSYHFPAALLLGNVQALYCYLPCLYYAAFFQTVKKQPLLTLLLIYITGYLLIYIGQGIPWYYHIYPVVGGTCFFFITACCVLQHKFASVIAALLAAFTIIFWINTLSYAVNQNENISPIIHYLQKHTKQNIYFISAKTTYIVSALEHADVEHNTRFQTHNWLNCYYQCSPTMLDNNSAFYKNYQQTLAYLVSLFAEDISNTKPILILVDDNSYTTAYGEKKLNLLTILKQNALFAAAWRPYKFTRILTGQEGENRFLVYARQP